jgi:hypothetical protein
MKRVGGCLVFCVILAGVLIVGITIFDYYTARIPWHR